MAMKPSSTVRRGSHARALHRTVSTVALLAGSMVVASATSATAQCVQGPPNSYTCSGALTATQAVSGPTLFITTTPGFSVDTTGNGGGRSLQAWGTGSIGYLDQNSSRLAGGGAHFRTLTGNIGITATGAIDADDAADGLWVENLGIGDTQMIWTGPITNVSGVGARVSGFGDIAVTIDTITALGEGLVINQNGAGGVSLVATGGVNSTTGRGILVDAGADAGDVVIDVQSVSGEDGISVYNGGTGGTFVRAGSVTGTNPFGVGVQVSTGFLAREVLVDVGDVTGGSYGVAVVSSGSQGTVVRTGDVTAGFTGVSVTGDDAARDLDVTTGSVDAGVTGVNITNFGFGDTTLSVNGTVTAGTGDGVFAYNENNAGSLFLDVDDVTGGTGVRTLNFGSGETTVVADGAIIGTAEHGVSAFNDTAATDMVLVLQSVQGASGGIYATNLGTGQTFIAAQGPVFGADADGVSVDVGSGGGNLQIQLAATTGQNNGISVGNGGAGTTAVYLAADVVGQVEDGLTLFNGAQTTGLTVSGRNIRGAGYGVFGRNFGTGDSYLQSTGSIIGETRDGIRMRHAGGPGRLLIDVANVVGAETAVVASNEGGGRVDLTLRGQVQGGVLGVEAYADASNEVSITNLGLLRLTSGGTSEAVLSATAGRVDLINSGGMIGSVNIAAGSSLLLNEGGWNTTGGTSFFSGADDAVFNASSGLILLADNAAVEQSTVWSGLERFDNAGTLSLADNGSGDVLRTVTAATFLDGSSFAVDIGGPGGADLFQNFGTVDIQAGSALLVNIAGTLSLNERYVVAQATEGLTGEFLFDDVMLTAFAGLRDGYTDQTAFIELVQLKALADAGITPNQKETAAGADSLPDGNAVKDALVMLPDDAAAIDAFDQLSGELHPAARTAMIDDSRFLRDASLSRLADGGSGGAVWGRVIASDGVSFGDSNAARTDRDSRGVLAGIDTSILGGLTAGIAAGWVETDVAIDRRDSVATVESLQGLAYIGGRFGAWGVRAGVGYAGTSAESQRAVSFPGFGADLTADYKGSVLQGFAEVGYRLPARGGYAEPFVNLTTLRAETDDFTETSGPAALRVEASEQDVTVSTLGMRFETNPMGAFSIRGVAGWRHAWGDLEPVGRHAFEGGETFTVLGAAQSQDAAVATVEAQWRLAPNVALGVAYDSVLGTDSSDHAITAGVKIVF